MAGALAGLCILVAGCSANSNRATPTTTPSTTVPPVAQGALDELLLSASQINAAMGATELSVADDTKRMEDVSANGVARSAFPFTVQRRPMPTPTVDGPGFTDNFWASHRTLMWPSRVSCCFHSATGQRILHRLGATLAGLLQRELYPHHVRRL
jgi:hypothetical protein